MNRTKKQETVEALASRLQASEHLYLTDFTGIAVQPMTELRRKLKEAGSEYMVVKNTLALRALEAASVEGLEQELDGPTAFVFVHTDPIGTAKVLADFQKEHDVLAIKAGVVEGRRVSPEDVARLAKLPPRDQLLAQVGGALQAPLQGFVGMLTSFLHQVVGALEALKAQKSGT